METNLVRALEKDSEILQNIADQFVPLMANFRILFLWEQEKMDLIYTKELIVEETSAAPIIANTERSGVPADHVGMCKFRDSTSAGFRTVISALLRYCKDAPSVIYDRRLRTGKKLEEMRQDEARELLRGLQRSSPGSYPAPSRILPTSGQIDTRPQDDDSPSWFRRAASGALLPLFHENGPSVL